MNASRTARIGWVIKVDCEIMKAKVCNPEAQPCRTVNGIETCSCQVGE